MRVLTVVAPTVGGLAGEALERNLASAGLAWERLAFEPGCDLAAAVAARAGEGWNCVVAVGGDGTVACVAHALAGREVPLGIVPAGTGNLVARELGIPISVAESVRVVAACARTTRMDAMRINGRTYLLNAGVGINAETIDETSRLGKSLFGVSAYVGTAVWKVLQARPQWIEVTIDGVTRAFQATDVAISNCGILARALNPAAPDIRPDDGRIHVCILCMKSPLEVPWYYLLQRIAPKRVNRVMHEFVAERHVCVRSREPIMVQADGDIIGKTPVDVEVVPAALSVIVPAGRVA